MGRPTKLTPERQEAICAHVRDQQFIETACALVGIDKTTHYGWLNRAQAELNRLDELRDEGEEDPQPDPDEAPFIDYLHAFSRARAEAEAAAVQVLRETGQGYRVVKRKRRMDKDGNILEEHTEEYTERDWRAALEYLERSFPDRWRKPSRVEVSGRDGGPVEHTVAAEVRYTMVDNGRDPRITRRSGDHAGNGKRTEHQEAGQR